MDWVPAASRTTSKARQPLGDATSRANALHPSDATQAKGKHGSSVAQPPSRQELSHDAVSAHTALTLRTYSAPVENKRLSAVTEDTYDPRRDSKRDSQVSSTSTNTSSKGPRRKTHIGPWLLGSDIGNGGCGKVRKVKHSLTGQVAAAKIISKQTAEKARAESLMNLVEAQKLGNGSLGLPNKHVMPFGVEREIVIMKLLEHPNIVQLYDVWENRSELYLIMEHVDGGELFDYVDRVSFLREDEAVWVFRQVIAALLHCHRLGIYHRDLKPENILLDTSASPQVKLIDFGMAALQPQGQLLTTPCGSIHYAAPEVFERNYDGSKADVWSLGIILFVMLTGTTPFPHDASVKNDTDRWYRLIKAGRFNMPDYISPEAADLIRRMLMPDPARRITLEGCWHHPLVKTYNQVWSSDPRHNSLDYWVGTRPMIDHWNIKSRTDIDLEILINLRCLWHSAEEEFIVEQILSGDANQEKYFYWALQRYRDEQLENYVGTFDPMGHSPSDYHHTKAPTADELPPVPLSAYSRTRSQFSIMNDHDINDVQESKNSLRGGGSSIVSYDPYRASREKLFESKGNYNMTVYLHDQSQQSRRRSQTTPRAHNNSLRVHGQQESGRRVSVTSSKASLRGLSSSVMTARSYSRSISRVSLSSRASFYPSSPPRAVSRPNLRAKRPVTFVSSRRASTVSLDVSNFSLLENKRSSSHTTGPKRSSVSARKSSSTSAVGQGPTLRVVNRTVDSVISAANPSLKIRKQRTQSQLLDSEARKVSSELEKYCEELFYRSSGQSSRASGTTQVYETPPSSISQYETADSQIEFTGNSHKSDASNKYLVHELSESRRRSSARYAYDDTTNMSSSYQEALAHIDSMLNFNSRSGLGGIETSRSSDRMDVLPIITEESRGQEAENAAHLDVQKPTRASNTTGQTQLREATVRMIDQLPLARPAPLVIRKSSGVTSESTTEEAGGSSAPGRPVKPLVNHERKVRTVLPELPDSESDDLLRPALVTSEAKSARRKGWFARKRTSSAEQEEHSYGPAAHQSLQNSGAQVKVIEPRSNLQPPSPAPNEKSGFFGFLRKKRASSSSGRMAMGGDEDDIDTQSNVTATSNNSRARRVFQPSEVQKRLEARDLGVQQNWFTRFFKIQPASRTLCFRRGRGVARQELVRLLRSWRPYGIKDVVLDRPRNLIWGRLASPNYLGIKEIQFVIELFVVLEYGRRANLSLARFTQRSGAASSFRKVVDTLDSVLRSKGLVVEDERRQKEMEAILTG